MTDSCPRGITFGNTVTLSPPGERVLNPHTSYFNNGDYVVIWTEETSNGPRIEFQLFDGGNNEHIACTGFRSSCSGELVKAPQQKIGTTAVGVYEDYSFLIAWSQLENTYSKWQLNIIEYKYDVSSKSYTLSNYNIPSIELSADFFGKFAFATLSLDNSFIISHMKDQQTIVTQRYDRNRDYSSPNTIQKEVSYTQFMDIIVKTVPTQYFFSVVWSPLMKNSGITVQNYRINDLEEVEFFDINNNPREIYADLSYGGILSVAWLEAATECSLTPALVYNMKMFSANETLTEEAFEISDKNNTEENTNSYLQQVITQSQSRVVATFLKQAKSGDKYVVRIFDSNGDFIASNIESLIPTASRLTTARTLLQTPPSTCKREREELPTQPLGTETSQEARAQPSAEIPVSPEYTPEGNVMLIAGGNQNERSVLNKVINELTSLFKKVDITQYDEEYEQEERNQVLIKFQPIFRTFISNSQKGIGYFIKEFPNEAETKFLFKYNFKCQRRGINLYSDVAQKTIYLCPEFLQLPDYPDPNTLTYGTKLGELGIEMYLLKLNKEFKDNLVPLDKCVAEYAAKGKINAYCVKYFLESSYTASICNRIYPDKAGMLCNTSSVQSSLYVSSQSLNFINNIVYRMASANYKSVKDLPGNLKEIYEEIIGNEETAPWEVTKNALSYYYNGLLDFSEPNFIYGDSTTFCLRSSSVLAYTEAIGDLTNVFLCQSFIDIDENGFPEINDVKKDTKLLVIIHELTHAYFGATDYLDDDEDVSFYGYDECKKWKDIHPPLSQPSDLVADCISLFIQYAAYYSE